jgi:hypothetical protein
VARSKNRLKQTINRAKSNSLSIIGPCSRELMDRLLIQSLNGEPVTADDMLFCSLGVQEDYQSNLPTIADESGRAMIPDQMMRTMMDWLRVRGQSYHC